MVRAPPRIAPISAARRLASYKSATAMGSAAVTAASAAAALMPFVMGLGCLPAKGASRNFSIERLVLLPGMMAMTSFATAAASPLLEGASTRLTRCYDLSSKARPGQPRPQCAFTHAKRRLGPKSTVFSAFKLDSARCKLAFTSSGRSSHVF